MSDTPPSPEQDSLQQASAQLGAAFEQHLTDLGLPDDEAARAPFRRAFGMYMAALNHAATTASSGWTLRLFAWMDEFDKRLAHLEERHIDDRHR